VKKFFFSTFVLFVLALLPKPATSQPFGCTQADYDLWLSQYEQQVEPGTGADWNGDGVVDGQDYVIWLNSCDNTEVPVTSEPDPATEIPQPNLPTCSIDGFSVSPGSGNVGMTFTLSGRGSCSSGVRAIRFKVDGGIIFEIGAPEASTSWNSAGASSGDHIATIEVAGHGDNDWVAAASSSQSFSVTGTDPSLPSCSVQSFTISPTSGSPGTPFTISGSGDCNTGVRAIRFKIDGGIVYEQGGPSATTTWSSSGASIGAHAVTVEVAGIGDNNWAAAASQTLQFSITGGGGQGPIQPPVTNNNWAAGNTVYLCQGTEIRHGSNLSHGVHTIVPVNNWPVTVIGGPRFEDGATWWDISRADGGSGWVQQSQADCGTPVSRPEGSQPIEPQPPSSNPYRDCGASSPAWLHSIHVTASEIVNIRQTPAGTIIGSACPNSYYEYAGNSITHSDGYTWHFLNFSAGQGWVRADVARVVSITSPDPQQGNVCTSEWAPTVINDGAEVWIAYTEYATKIQNLRNQENNALNILIESVWWREILEEIGQASFEKLLEYLLPKLGNYIRAGGFALTLLQFGEIYFKETSVSDARQLYQNSRTLREDLEQYDTNQYRCGSWIRVPLSLWDSPLFAFGNPIGFFMNFLPVDADLTCREFPDTCYLFE
jgi:hypothetical protein